MHKLKKLKTKSCVRLIHSLLFIFSLVIDSLIKQQSGFWILILPLFFTLQAEHCHKYGNTSSWWSFSNQNYRHLLILKLINSHDNNTTITASVYTAILRIHKAWRLVTQVCFQNCYRRGEFQQTASDNDDCRIFQLFYFIYFNWWINKFYSTILVFVFLYSEKRCHILKV